MNRSFRTLVLPSSFAALVFAAQMGEAKAACATTDPQCSFGPVTGLEATRAEGPEDYVVGFNWDQDLGSGFRVGIGAGLKLVPKDNEPFYSVDMSASAKPPVVQAEWASDKTIRLTFLDSANADATFSAKYGLAVQVHFTGDTPFTSPIEKTWDFSDQLTNLGNTDFNFEAEKSIQFKPWGVAAPVDMVVAGGSVDDTSLFNVTLEDVGLDIGCGQYTCATGNLGVYISTEGTIFRYRTVGARFNGTSFDTSKDMPLAKQTEYGDELSVKATLTGGVTIDGDLYAKPYVQLTSIYGYGPGGTRGSDGGVSWPLSYASNTLAIHNEFTLPADPAQSLTVDYPETTILIPIPNVKLSKTALAMTGKSGQITINNTGKKTARVSFSSEGGFTVPGGEQDIEAGGSYDLKVSYSGAEATTGEVSITTNDPDSPVLVLKVGANGAPVGEGPDDDDGTTSSGGASPGLDDTAEEGGCGCTTTTPSNTTGFGAIFGSALAAMAFLKRRFKR